MLRILRDGAHMYDSVKHYVLSPQSELSVFRHGLEKLGISILEEQMLMDEGKYYVILHAAPGSMHYEQEYEYRYGSDLIRKQDPVLREFLERELAQGEELLAHLSLTADGRCTETCREPETGVKRDEGGIPCFAGN